MEAQFKVRLKRTILILILLFIGLFIFRLIYGYTESSNQENYGYYQNDFFQNMSGIRKNYASKKYEKTVTMDQSAVNVDQKYEKIASINTKSTEFDTEEKMVRDNIEHLKGLIQFEQKSGNKGERILNLMIGVPPENFDTLYVALTKIGKVYSKQITKKDKTNEYKELNARKISLEKNLASLIALKQKGGKIEEYMQLENRILELEQQLQGLGVSLGDFDAENEFCTVNFSLNESKIQNFSFIQRVKVSLEWTIKYYLGFITILFFILLFSYILLILIDKLKLISRTLK